jgi:hypothetical protein
VRQGKDRGDDVGNLRGEMEKLQGENRLVLDRSDKMDAQEKD